MAVLGKGCMACNIFLLKAMQAPQYEHFIMFFNKPFPEL